MNARDTSTLHQVALAATLGLDARALLATDDAATHIVYAKLSDTLGDLYRLRVSTEQHNTAVAIINMLGEAFGRRA
jgi:hypothetical protein